MATAIYFGLMFIASEINPGSFSVTEHELMMKMAIFVIGYDCCILLIDTFKVNKRGKQL